MGSFTSTREEEMKTRNGSAKERLSLEALNVETFEAGSAELPVFIVTHATGIDSTCPCCSENFTCPCSFPCRE